MQAGKCARAKVKAQCIMLQGQKLVAGETRQAMLAAKEPCVQCGKARRGKARKEERGLNAKRKRAKMANTD